jgi:hypothetical protein
MRRRLHYGSSGVMHWYPFSIEHVRLEKRAKNAEASLTKPTPAAPLASVETNSTRSPEALRPHLSMGLPFVKIRH